MRLELRRFGMAIGTAAVLGAPTWADELKKIEVSEIPAAVRQAAERAAPGAAWSEAAAGRGGRVTTAARTAEQSADLYQLKGKDAQGRRVETEVTAAGVVLEVETEIPTDEMPQAVVDALKAEMKGFQPASVSSVARQGQVDWYKVEGKTDGRETVVRVSADGKTVREQEPAERPEGTEAMVENAKYIFKGTVMKRGAATMPNVEVTDRTLVVRVDHLFRAPKVLLHSVGKEITVELSEPAEAGPGQQGIFFTNELVYGKSLAVQGVGKFGSEADLDRLAGEVSQAVEAQPGEDLKRHIDEADAVVTGAVKEIRPVAPTGPRQPISWHDPDWHLAVIEVERVEKGEPPRGTVAVVFPRSDDRRWFRYPKFRPGQQGVWLLHKTPDQQVRSEHVKALLARGTTEGMAVYTAFDPTDYHPVSQIEEIRRLAGRR